MALPSVFPIDSPTTETFRTRSCPRDSEGFLARWRRKDTRIQGNVIRLRGMGYNIFYIIGVIVVIVVILKFLGVVLTAGVRS